MAEMLALLSQSGATDDDETQHEPAPKKPRIDSVEVGAGELGPPEQGRSRTPAKYVSKIALGVLGVVLSLADSLLGQKTLSRQCQFCQCSVGTPDLLDPNLTMAWHKPKQEGKCCAYCGASKAKLYPTKPNKEVSTLVKTDEKESAKFWKYRDFLLEKHRAGCKCARGRFDEMPEQVEEYQNIELEKRDKGKAVLYDDYVKSEGDPVANGHKVTWTTWKDNTRQKVVLVPLSKPSEMECDWVYRAGASHRRVLDDGQLNLEAGRQQQLFDDLRAQRGRTQLSGQVLAPSSAQGAEVAASGAQQYLPTGSERAAATPAKARPGAEQEEEEEDADDGIPAMGDVMMLSAVAALEGHPSPGGASAGMGVGRKPAAAKGKAKAKAGSQVSMPPPLKGSGGGAGGGAKLKLPPGAANTVGALDKTVQKAEQTISEFTAMQRHVIQHEKDKGYYKTLNKLQKELTGLCSVCPADKMPTVNRLAKSLGLITRVMKNWKNWAKKGDDVAYMQEQAEILDFAALPEPVTLALPRCILQDEIEIFFSADVVQAALRNDVGGMAERWQKLCLTAIQAYFTSDEAEQFQVRVTEAALQKLLHSPDVNKDSEVLRKALLCWLAPATGTPAFQLVDSVRAPARLLHLVLDSSAFGGQCTAVSDTIKEVERSSEFLCRVVNALPVGGSLLNHVGGLVRKVAELEAAEERMTQLSGNISGGPGHDVADPVQALLSLDIERAKFIAAGNTVPADVVASYDKLVARRLQARFQEIVDSVSGGLFLGKFTDYSAGKASALFASPVAEVTSLGRLAHLSDSARDACNFVTTLCNGPWQLACCSQSAVGDMSQVEDLASTISALADLRAKFAADGQRLLFGDEQDVATRNEEVIANLLKMGTEAMAGFAAKSLCPKVAVVMPLVVADPCWQHGLADRVAIGKFILEAERGELEILYKKFVPSAGKMDAALDHIRCMCNALGSSVLAVVVDIQVCLTRLRCACANAMALQQQLAGGLTDSDVAAVGEVASLAKAGFDVQQKFTADVAGPIAAVAALPTERLFGVRPIDCGIEDLQTFAKLAVSAVTAVVTLLHADWSRRLDKMAKDVKAMIPEYEPFVKDTFDGEKVKAEIIEKPWEPLLGQWVVLRKVLTALRSSPNPLGCSFAEAHSTVIADVDIVLKSVKDFMAVVSACSLILVDLPALPRGKRFQPISELLESSRTTGAEIPANLKTWLEAEQRKCRK